MRSVFHNFILSVLLLVSCTPDRVDYKGMSVYETGIRIILENKNVKLEFNEEKGRFSAYHKLRNSIIIDSAIACWNENMSDSYKTFRWEAEPDSNILWLQITALKKNAPELVLSYGLSANQNFFLLKTGVKNSTEDTLQVYQLSPMIHARLFPEKDSFPNFRILDGNGGGEETRMHATSSLFCRNNLLFTFSDSKGRQSLVLGGVKYVDFEKFAWISSSNNRKKDLQSRLLPEQKLIAYLDFPGVREDGMKPFLHLGLGYAYRFQGAPFEEASTVVYSGNNIIFSALKTDPARKYSVGVSWIQDSDSREQFIFVDNGEGTPGDTIVPAQKLPSISKGMGPEEIVFDIPESISRKGWFRVVVGKMKGPNVVLSEAWLCEGTSHNPAFKKNIISYTDTLSMNKPIGGFLAKDPVGKRINPGDTYFSNDIFYVDYSTPDPFQALENYSFTFRDISDIKLNYYTFPSVCLWYAMHPWYGGGPAVNDSKGAVEEMERIRNSGFLNFSTAAVRLVPDCYEENNEQGWWTDERFQMYGSGSAVPGEVTVNKHYTEPYETTAKWAGEIKKTGGLSLIYVQTAKRSQDYADSFPEHMLYNQSNAFVPDYDWTVRNKASYDFTDSGFIEHMKSVYAKFRTGGISGMMFDYTNTGWPVWGGMEDKYSTASAAYKSIFRLAYEGLGPGCFLHERCLEKGSDLTLGLVTSQRIWGDTDDVIPEMIMRGGLRWYKNRVIINYDMDAKNLLKAKPAASVDGRRKLLTMAYVTSGRLLLANSFGRLNKEILHDLTRIFPFHTSPRSARPVNAFLQTIPTVYDFAVDSQWHQLTLYNPDNTSDAIERICLYLSNADGGLELAFEKEYHLFDFWNHSYLGKFRGDTTLAFPLRPGEARMISVREMLPYPQVISSSRHIMQGLLELQNVRWNRDTKTLEGDASLVGKDELRITVALNGMTFISCSSSLSNSVWKNYPNGIGELILKSDQSATTHWIISFE